MRMCRGGGKGTYCRQFTCSVYAFEGAGERKGLDRKVKQGRGYERKGLVRKEKQGRGYERKGLDRKEKQGRGYERKREDMIERETI